MCSDLHINYRSLAVFFPAASNRNPAAIPPKPEPITIASKLAAFVPTIIDPHLTHLGTSFAPFRKFYPYLSIERRVKNCLWLRHRITVMESNHPYVLGAFLTFGIEIPSGFRRFSHLFDPQ
jgi:hypothetical protein